MSGGGTTQNTIQNKDPWAPAQPHLQDIMGQAGSLYKSGAGSQTWGGPLVAQFDPATAAGLTLGANTAYSNAPNAGAAYNYGVNQIQNNGLTPAYNAPMSTYGGIASGANGITTGGQFGDIASGVGPTAASQYLTGMASGADAGKNPALETMLQDNAARIGNRVASQMSGAGRFGSFGHGDAMARSITAANAPIISGAYENDRNRMLAASGQIDSSQRAADATRLAALTGQTGVQGQNISNQMQGAAGQTGILNTGQNNALGWMSQLPTANNLQYDPSTRLMGLGGINDARNQQVIDAQRQLFEQQNNMPWTQLNKYLGGVSGLGGLLQGMGTSTGQSQTEQQTPWTTYAGLGISALGLMSDRNEKTDIKKVGKDENTGLPLYAYRYKDDPKTYPKIVGPMAQDVEKAFPGSTDRVGGKLYIKNAALGIAGL